MDLCKWIVEYLPDGDVRNYQAGASPVLLPAGWSTMAIDHLVNEYFCNILLDWSLNREPYCARQLSSRFFQFFE